MNISQRVYSSLTEERWTMTTIGTEGSENRCLFSSVRNCRASFPARWTNPFIRTTRERSSCAQPHQHLSLSVFFTSALLAGLWGPLTGVSLPSCRVLDHFSEFHFGFPESAFSCSSVHGFLRGCSEYGNIPAQLIRIHRGDA